MGSVSAQLTSALVVQNFQAGQVIVKEGETGDVLYILKSGEAVVTIQGKEVRMLEVGSGKEVLSSREVWTFSESSSEWGGCLVVAARRLLR